jgi:hypothetical protein
MKLSRQADSVASRSFPLVPATTVTTAVSGVVFGAVIPALLGLKSLTCQAIFTYGSGGTAAKFYVQTSLDNGVTWTDIMSFAFATATLTKQSSTKFTVALAPAITPTGGTLADNTILDGLIGDQVRVLGTTTGTYAGGTTISISAVAKG